MGSESNSHDFHPSLAVHSPKTSSLRHTSDGKSDIDTPELCPPIAEADTKEDPPSPELSILVYTSTSQNETPAVCQTSRPYIKPRDHDSMATSTSVAPSTKGSYKAMEISFDEAQKCISRL